VPGFSSPKRKTSPLRFADYLPCCLVEPDTEKARMAQLVVAGPLEESDLHNDLRSHPVRAYAWQTFPLRERRARNLERVQAIAQLEQQLRVEACSDFAREHEVIVLEVADQQCA